jgi:hypothetical protein
VYISDKGRLFVRELRTSERGRLDQIKERAQAEDDLEIGELEAGRSSFRELNGRLRQHLTPSIGLKF